MVTDESKDTEVTPGSKNSQRKKEMDFAGSVKGNIGKGNTFKTWQIRSMRNSCFCQNTKGLAQVTRIVFFPVHNHKQF